MESNNNNISKYRSESLKRAQSKYFQKLKEEEPEKYKKRLQYTNEYLKIQKIKKQEELLNDIETKLNNISLKDIAKYLLNNNYKHFFNNI